jgi:hypothetical protein
MDETDFDFLCEELPPVEAKRLRKVLIQWCAGDENSFPVQLALLTRAQWYAAAQTPVLLKQSLELLERKLADYRQQTAALLANFNAATDTKVKALEEILAEQRDSAQQVLTDLCRHTTTAKSLLSKIERELTKGTAELERFRNQFIDERHRLEESRVRYEQQKDWSDWIVFGFLLLAMVLIGILIGWRWS